MFTLDEFRAAVIEGIKKLNHEDEVVIADDEDFGDYGLDSLTGISLVLEVESTLGVDFGEFDIDDANTITLFHAKAKRLIEELE